MKKTGLYLIIAFAALASACGGGDEAIEGEQDIDETESAVTTDFYSLRFDRDGRCIARSGTSVVKASCDGSLGTRVTNEGSGIRWSGSRTAILDVTGSTLRPYDTGSNMRIVIGTNKLYEVNLSPLTSCFAVTSFPHACVIAANPRTGRCVCLAPATQPYMCNCDSIFSTFTRLP